MARNRYCSSAKFLVELKYWDLLGMAPLLPLPASTESLGPKTEMGTQNRDPSTLFKVHVSVAVGFFTSYGSGITASNACKYMF